MNLSLFDFNYRDFFFFVDRELFFYIKKTVIVDCLKLGKVIVLQLLIHFL